MGTLNDAKMSSLNDKISEKATVAGDKIKKVKTKKVALGKAEEKKKGKS